jgi:hypothetical protein
MERGSDVLSPELAEGIDFAYGVATDKLSAQLSSADRVDTKLGVLIAALASVAALYSATATFKIAGLLFLVPAGIAFVGYRAREWQNPPDPTALTTKYAKQGKTAMQEQALAVILEAYGVNQEQLARKSGLFNLSLWATLTVVVLVLLLSLVLPGK